MPAKFEGFAPVLQVFDTIDKRPSTPPPQRFAAHRDAGLFFGCRVDAACSYLGSKGVRFEPPSVAPYGMKQLWLVDPDGYEPCLQWPVA